MEISGVSSKAYTSAAKGVDEEEKVEEEQEEQSTQKPKNMEFLRKKKKIKMSQNFLLPIMENLILKKKRKII